MAMNDPTQGNDDTLNVIQQLLASLLGLLKAPQTTPPPSMGMGMDTQRQGMPMLDATGIPMAGGATPFGKISSPMRPSLPSMGPQDYVGKMGEGFDVRRGGKLRGNFPTQNIAENLFNVEDDEFSAIQQFIDFIMKQKSPNTSPPVSQTMMENTSKTKEDWLRQAEAVMGKRNYTIPGFM